jgi:hypothetical protein
MKREEWYNSVQFKKLRLLNNWSHEIQHMLQQLRDVFEIVVDENLGATCTDKYSLAERQLRITSMEAVNLIRVIDNFARMLEPKKFDDWPTPESNESLGTPSENPESKIGGM